MVKGPGQTLYWTSPKGLGSIAAGHCRKIVNVTVVVFFPALASRSGQHIAFFKEGENGGGSRDGNNLSEIFTGSLFVLVK